MRKLAFIVLILTAFPLTAKHRAVAKPPYLQTIGHVFIVVLENTDGAVAEELPFIKRVSAKGALLENYHGVAHPSQPNYIAMTSGSTQGVTSDSTVTLDVPHIGDLIERRGLTWKAYAENYPGDCYVGAISGAPADGSYVRRHEPFIEFKNVQDNLTRCREHIVNATQLDADIASGALPNFAFYTPNDIHNGHDSSPATADAWLEQRFGPLLDDPRFMDSMLFIITWDESNSHSDSTVTTVLLGPDVKPGFETFAAYDHYALLRTIEEILGIGTLGRSDAAARPITDVWR